MATTHDERIPTMTCTVQYAVTGKCGKPAVFSYTQPWEGGETFHECAQHAADPNSLARAYAATPARKPTSFEVLGQKVRYRGNHRFIVVAVRPEPITVDAGQYGGVATGVYVAFARVDKRTDNSRTASEFARKASYTRGPGVKYAVVDTSNGDIVETR
jgi:hypothetical protein